MHALDLWVQRRGGTVASLVAYITHDWLIMKRFTVNEADVEFTNMESEWGKQDGVEKEWEYNSEPVSLHLSQKVIDEGRRKLKEMKEKGNSSTPVEQNIAD